MEWNSAFGIVVTGVLSAIVYQAGKGDTWPKEVNMLAGVGIAFLAGFLGLADNMPALQVQGTGAEGLFAAMSGALAHGVGLKGKPLGQALKLGLVPRVLGVAAELASGMAKTAKNDKPSGT